MYHYLCIDKSLTIGHLSILYEDSSVFPTHHCSIVHSKRLLLLSRTCSLQDNRPCICISVHLKQKINFKFFSTKLIPFFKQPVIVFVTVKHPYCHLLVSCGNVMAEINRNIRYLCSVNIEVNIVTLIPAAMQDQ